MIKISVPNDDHVALRAMSKALEEIAVARGAPLQVNLVTEEMLDKLKETRGSNIICEPEVDTISQQVESLATPVADRTVYLPEPIVCGATTDSTDTPWDERIHSASKALNADGTWRLRRKPKDMDEAEWTTLVESIKSELQYREQLKKQSFDAEQQPINLNYASIDPAHEKGDETAELTIEPPVTPPGDDFHVDAGVVTEQQVADIPPPPPVPVNKVVSTYQGADGGQHDIITLGGSQTAHMTFPQVMAYLTERHRRISNAQVEQIIAEMGLKSIMDLNTQPEHTGPFIARVKALLGE